MINSYQKLYVHTFGQLIIKKGDEILFSGNKKLNKRWKLFLLLLCKRGESISDNKLIFELGLEENATPRQSLRALIYRLRKEINGKKNNGDYILTKKGGYAFNPESYFWLDCEKFKEIIKKAKKEEKNNINSEVLRLYQNGLRLYRGSFLENHKIENNELLEKRNFYRNLFLKTVQTYAKHYLKRNELDKAIDLFETALQLYPLNVDIYLSLIKTLKKAERPDIARIRAEEALSFLRNAGLDIPSRLEKEVSQFLQIKLDQKPEFALDNNSDKHGRVFECGPLTFSNIYDLEKRRAQRSNTDIKLVHLKLSKGDLPEKIRKAENILREILHVSLRSSDIITRWEPRHYLLLALNLSEDKIIKILQRIESCYEDKYPPAEIDLVYKFEKV